MDYLETKRSQIPIQHIMPTGQMQNIIELHRQFHITNKVQIEKNNDRIINVTNIILCGWI